MECPLTPLHYMGSGEGATKRGMASHSTVIYGERGGGSKSWNALSLHCIIWVAARGQQINGMPSHSTALYGEQRGTVNHVWNAP